MVGNAEQYAALVAQASDEDLERGLGEKLLDMVAAVEVPGTAAWAAMDSAPIRPIRKTAALKMVIW